MADEAPKSVEEQLRISKGKLEWLKWNERRKRAEEDRDYYAAQSDIPDVMAAAPQFADAAQALTAALNQAEARLAELAEFADRPKRK